MTEKVLEIIRIGEQIKTLRTLRGLSQQELGRRTSLSQFVISFIETNRANPTDEQMEAIKAALSWPSDEAVKAAFELLAAETAESAQ